MNGETPANDCRVAPEPIVLGNGLPNVLWKSTNDISGPWTAVWTNMPSATNPSASGSYIDGALTGSSKVFYKVTQLEGVKPASIPLR